VVAIHPNAASKEEYTMKKLVLAAGAALCFIAGVAIAQVRDWPDLVHAHEHTQAAIDDMARARAANHYDMAGHGARAEQLLRDADHEIGEARRAAAMH
jgi:hypothetical protein